MCMYNNYIYNDSFTAIPYCHLILSILKNNIFFLSLITYLSSLFCSHLFCEFICERSRMPTWGSIPSEIVRVYSVSVSQSNSISPPYWFWLDVQVPGSTFSQHYYPKEFQISTAVLSRASPCLLEAWSMLTSDLVPWGSSHPHTHLTTPVANLLSYCSYLASRHSFIIP